MYICIVPYVLCSILISWHFTYRNCREFSNRVLLPFSIKKCVSMSY